MSLRILQTNDFHGTLDEAKFARLSELRAETDLYFDCGDCIKAGNLAIPLRREPVWEKLDRLRCDGSVLGNRETHLLESAFQAKIQGASHPLLCGNLHFRDGKMPLPATLTLEKSSLKIGVVAVMVPMVTERMATQRASSYLWDPPIPTAVRLAKELRPHVDCLIALTHIGISKDRELAQQTDLFDLILGGHSHTVLEKPEIIAGTPIFQTGSHGRFAGVIEWEPGRGVTSSNLVALP